MVEIHRSERSPEEIVGRDAYLQLVFEGWHCERQWQPIETAPKDGTEIWLAGVCAYPSIDAGEHTIVKAYWTDHNDGGWVWYGAAMNFQAWRPIPDLPTMVNN